jgi:prepilin-type N-terminal cleavage/methylation domain-containing protein
MFKAIFPRYSVGDRRLLKSVRQSAQQGFTMFEVLIALMISFLFLTGTLNAMVMATVMRVRAERQAQAGYWIKEDLENVRADAAAFLDVSGCPNIGTSYASTGTMAPDDGIPLVVGTGTETATTNTKTILGRNTRLTRTATPVGNVLQLSYLVENTEIADTTENRRQRRLAELYTEVLPAAALDCP